LEIKILLDGKIVKITDFNVSKFIENKRKKFSFLTAENYKMWTYTGTIAFTAPEVFNDSEYTYLIYNEKNFNSFILEKQLICGVLVLFFIPCFVVINLSKLNSIFFLKII